MRTCETLSVPGNKISCLNLNIVYAGKPTQLKEGWLMMVGAVRYTHSTLSVGKPRTWGRGVQNGVVRKGNSYRT